MCGIFKCCRPEKILTKHEDRMSLNIMRYPFASVSTLQCGSSSLHFAEQPGVKLHTPILWPVPVRRISMSRCESRLCATILYTLHKVHIFQCQSMWQWVALDEEKESSAMSIVCST